MRPWGRLRMRGFTLVELLVALFVLLVLSLMSWRGLDGMLRANAQVRQHTDEVLALQTGLAQWTMDLDSQLIAGKVVPIDWDGRVLRITRASPDPANSGVQVVAWALRSVQGMNQWVRWQSNLLRTQQQWLLAWQQAQTWAQNPGELAANNEVPVTPLEQWQIYYYRSNAWTNPLSSAGGGTSAQPDLPDGVRLVLTLPPQRALSGTLTIDWVRPTATGAKS